MLILCIILLLLKGQFNVWGLVSRVSLSVARPVCSSVLNWIVTEEMVEQLAKTSIQLHVVFLGMESGRSRLMVRKLGSLRGQLDVWCSVTVVGAAAMRSMAAWWWSVYSQGMQALNNWPLLFHIMFLKYYQICLLILITLALSTLRTLIGREWGEVFNTRISSIRPPFLHAIKAGR